MCSTCGIFLSSSERQSIAFVNTSSTRAFSSAVGEIRERGGERGGREGGREREGREGEGGGGREGGREGEGREGVSH